MHDLDRRIAFGALSSRLVGGSPTRILFVYGGVATAISMWISNTATTAMMFPIGLSIVAHLTKGRESRARQPQLRDGDDADGGVWRIDRRHRHADRHAAEPDRHRHARAHRRHEQISFFQWMLLGVPLTVTPLCASSSSIFACALLKGLTIDTTQAGHIAGGTAEARADVDGAAQHAHRLWRHRRALALPGCTRRSWA